MNAHLRRGIEREIAIAIAGPIGERFAPVEPESRFLEDPQDGARAAQLAELLTLSPKEAVELDAFEASNHAESDKDRAYRRAFALAGSEIQAKYVSLIDAVVQQMALGERFRCLVAATSTEVLIYGVLPAAAVVSICERVAPRP